MASPLTASRHEDMTFSVENRARAAFGLLVVLGAVGGLLWYLLSSGHYARFEIRTHEPVSGLIAGAPVEFHGVEIGKVERVQLIDPHSVSILVSVKREAPVTRATAAVITSRGLAARGFTGYVFLDLEDTGNDSGPLTARPGSPYPLIRTVTSHSESLDTTADDLRRDVQALTALVQTVLDQRTVASLKGSLDNLQKVTTTLTANSEKLETMISNAERASRRLKPLLDSSQNTIGAVQTQVAPEAYDTLVKLNKLSNSLQEITAEIERDPSVLVRGKRQPPPGPGEKR